MKKLAILTAALAILLMGGAQVAMATLLDGTVDTSSSPYHGQWGTYDYAYLINTGTIFTPGPGTGGITLSGSVSNLSFGAYDNWLEIGLVATNVADAARAPGANPTDMNNQSAYFLVGKTGNDIYFEAGDYANCPQTGGILGDVTAFNFIFTVLPNTVGAGGTVTVTINGQTSSLPYGVDNVDAQKGVFLNKEFTGDYKDAYVVVHAFAQTGGLYDHDPNAFVKAHVNIVPLPSTLVLLGSGLAGLAFYRQRRASGRKS